MKNNSTNNNNSTAQESTYALLVRSEEKERNLFETAIYALFILSAVFSIWQFAHQPVPVPTRIGIATDRVAAVNGTVEVRS